MPDPALLSSLVELASGALQLAAGALSLAAVVVARRRRDERGDGPGRTDERSR